MSGEIRLGAGTAEEIASGHDAAAALIDGTAGAMPASVDGGAASALLGRILAGVSETAAGIADVSRASALVVRGVDSDVERTEASVASEFRDLTKEIQ